MSIFDFLYPKKCAGCGEIGTYFCRNCILSAKLHLSQSCPVCGRPSLDGVVHRFCQTRVSPDGLTVIWMYGGAPRRLITRLKYKFVREIALSLASSAAGILKNMQRSMPQAPAWNREKFVLVPIPLHWMRKNWRGFNHVEEMGKILAQMMRWEVAPLLVREKKTKSQATLKGKERRKNVAGAFSLNPNYSVLCDRNLVLFDDVWTTGATMQEACGVLKKAGARRVWCLALAR